MSNYAIPIPLMIKTPKYILNGIYAIQIDISSPQKDYKK
jgi:hypothetical protein